jgi:hypothetical protein
VFPREKRGVMEAFFCLIVVYVFVEGLRNEFQRHIIFGFGFGFGFV